MTFSARANGRLSLKIDDNYLWRFKIPLADNVQLSFVFVVVDNIVLIEGTHGRLNARPG